MHEKGLLPVHKTNDILAQALDKPDRSGRLRGVGAGVTMKEFYKKSKNNVKQSREQEAELLREQREMLQSQQSKMEKYEATQEELLLKISELQARLGEKEEDDTFFGVKYSSSQTTNDIDPTSATYKDLDTNLSNQAPKVSKNVSDLLFIYLFMYCICSISNVGESM